MELNWDYAKKPPEQKWKKTQNVDSLLNIG